MERFDLSSINLDSPRVRYRGRVLDKCALSSLIHEVAFLAGNCSWPLCSDIYWDIYTYADLKSLLLSWINKFE